MFPTNILYGQRVRIAELARKHRVATVFESSLFVEVGGLFSYGPRFNELLEQAAVYVDRILRGAKPGELPIVQPTQFELVVNLTTARALGIKIPQPILARADRVIE